MKQHQLHKKQWFLALEIYIAFKGDNFNKLGSRDTDVAGHIEYLIFQMEITNKK